MQQDLLNQIVLNVMAGKNKQEDVGVLRSIIEDLKSRGAEAIILGCTELPLAISQKDIDIQLFNSNQIILEEALARSLG